ncbi:MAG TPA: diguanylate cyclase [Rhodocyclaceae bacterium]|nr:diguanylate cyclase [Rhodocyclaceae bacterium]
MPEPTQPTEIAREVLMRLAQRRIQPTPDKYLALYHEIAGTEPSEAFPDKALQALTLAIPRITPDQIRYARQLDQAVTNRNWDGIKQALTDVFLRVGAEVPNWSAIIKDLLSQLEARSASGLTPAKKRESLDHVLASAATPDLLAQRLGGLLRSWSLTPGSPDIQLVDAVADLPETLVSGAAQTQATAAPTSVVDAGGGEWRELIALILDSALPPLLADSPEMAKEAQDLSKEVRSPQAVKKSDAYAKRLKKFIYRLHFVAEDQAEMRTALMGLLRLLVENIDELVVDDQWLQGQIAVVSDLMRQPLNLRHLDDVERRLKDLIFKQGALKQNLNEAKDRLKLMLASFIDRLADMTTATGEYHDKIETCATRISKANNISELTDVLDEVMRETRTIQLSALRSKEELTEMRQKVAETEKEVERLQNELAEASGMVRMDALTGALNRKGLEEAVDKEVARTHRHGTKLCMALLDIDNFKKLNDTLGHDAGDAALVHLSNVVRDTIRPQDTLARYGGEEFVILLPDTMLEDGVHAMVRVQRELTRRFFLHNNQKQLITFSCGVAELNTEEAPKECLTRADQAMYLAKRSGKNRVLAA